MDFIKTAAKIKAMKDEAFNLRQKAFAIDQAANDLYHEYQIEQRADYEANQIIADMSDDVARAILARLKALRS